MLLHAKGRHTPYSSSSHSSSQLHASLSFRASTLVGCPRLLPLVGLEFSFSRHLLCRVVSLGDILLSPGFCAFSSVWV